MGYAGAPGKCGKLLLKGDDTVDVLDLPYPSSVKIPRFFCVTHKALHDKDPNNAICEAGFHMTQLHGCWQVCRFVG
jgi:hypothetical protein